MIEVGKWYKAKQRSTRVVVGKCMRNDGHRIVLYIPDATPGVNGHGGNGCSDSGTYTVDKEICPHEQMEGHVWFFSPQDIIEEVEPPEEFR